MNDTKSFSTDNKLEVKLLLRRASCYEKSDEIVKAKQDLDNCTRLEP